MSDNSIAVIANSATQLHKNLQEMDNSLNKLVDMMASLRSLNVTFGSFLDGLLLTSTCTQFPEALHEPKIIEQPMSILPIIEPSPIEPPREVTEEPMDIDKEATPSPPPPTKTKTNRKRITKLPPSKKPTVPRINFPKDKIIFALPTKYQQTPHRKRMENLLDALRGSQTGLYPTTLIYTCS
eukprot:Ihof_evm8s23 gene=Ihof_evmTU8s23